MRSGAVLACQGVRKTKEYKNKNTERTFTMKVCEKILFDRPAGKVGSSWEPVSDERAEKWIREQAAELEKKKTVKANAARIRTNSVELDPMRLRYAFLGEVPNVTLRQIFAEPEKYVEAWEGIVYAVTGVRTYANEQERNIADLVKRIRTV